MLARLGTLGLGDGTVIAARLDSRDNMCGAYGEALL